MKKKVIIIGGGIAGLSAGIYALKAGYEAEIYEKNPLAGGECMGWNRKGYHIDNCIHWLTGTDSKTSMWKVWNDMGALDENTEYAKVDKFYSSCYEGKEATLWNDLERTKKELIELSPEDEAEISKFIEYVKYAEECTIPAEKPMDMMKIKDYISMGKRMANMPKVMKEYGKINLKDLAERFKSPVLKKLMTDYLPADYTAYSFLVSYGTMTSGNGDIPMGGSLAMTLRIVKKFKEMGGKLFTNIPVNKIIIENKTAVGIELENGEIIKGDEIISAVDTRFLYGKLIDESYMPKKWKRAYENSEGYPTTSGFQAAYAINADFSQGDTTFFDCEPFYIGNRLVDRIYIKNYAYDKSFAPEGKTVLQMNVPQTDNDFLFWKSLDDEEYKKVKEDLVRKVTNRIIKAFPELEGQIELLDSWTPITYERYCNAYHGAYMSFVTTTTAPKLTCKGTIKNLNNFYIAGQWIMSPGGLPIAAISGKFAIQRILKKEGRSIDFE